MPQVLGLLPGGGPLAAVAASMPDITEAAYAAVARRRSTLGRLLGRRACAVDPSRGRRRRRHGAMSASVTAVVAAHAVGGRPVPHRGHGEGGHHGRPSDRGLDPAVAPHRAGRTEATTRSRSTSGERASTRRASSPRWSTTRDSSAARRWTTGYATWIPGISVTSSATTCSAHARSADAAARAWSSRRPPYVRRAAFALVAAQAVHDHDRADAYFTAWLPRIRRAATDERTVVTKAVNWSLRQIGKRNAELSRGRRRGGRPACSRSRARAPDGSRAMRCASSAARPWSEAGHRPTVPPSVRRRRAGRAPGRRTCTRPPRHRARTARTRGRRRPRGARAPAPRSHRHRPTPRWRRPAGRSRRRPARPASKPSRSRFLA